MENNTGIVQARPAEWAIVRPMVKTDQAVAAWKEFQKLKHDLLDEDDSMMIGNKPFIKKSGWLKLATPFNLTDEILEESREDREDRSFVYRFKVRVTAPNGRSVVSVGSCASDEQLKYAHPEHDVRAKAHTRAKARAIADMVGGGGAVAEDVSDNEVERAKRSAAPDAPTRPGQAENPDEYDPAKNPDKMACPKCGKQVERQKSQRSGKFYYFCRDHPMEIRLKPGPDGKGVLYG